VGYGGGRSDVLYDDRTRLASEAFFRRGERGQISILEQCCRQLCSLAWPPEAAPDSSFGIAGVEFKFERVAALSTHRRLNPIL
jgi:hypothetical protein